MQSDVEKDSVKVTYLKGYPSLAQFIASDKDKSTAIYRRFDRLSARNLLYLQSELAELQARQDAFDEEDRNASTETKGIASNWEAFRGKAEEPNNTREKERMDLIKEIRDKLKEYREHVRGNGHVGRMLTIWKEEQFCWKALCSQSTAHPPEPLRHFRMFFIMSTLRLAMRHLVGTVKRSMMKKTTS
jgi:hypothetical protein